MVTLELAYNSPWFSNISVCLVSIATASLLFRTVFSRMVLWQIALEERVSLSEVEGKDWGFLSSGFLSFNTTHGVYRCLLALVCPLVGSGAWRTGTRK